MFAAVLAAASLVLSGCSGSDPVAEPAPRVTSPAAAPPAGSASSPAGGAAYYRQRLAWRDCSGGFSCSTLRVPLDYADASSRLIDVAVIRLPATDSGKRIGSLVINPGGPGGSGVDYARAARYLFPPPVLARFDVVGLDPRGVGGSTPVRCLSDRQLDSWVNQDPDPDNPAELAGLVAESRRYGTACRTRNRDLLAHVGTKDAARDMDVLRAALGDPKLTYLGKSYGTYLGTKYAELFPRRIRALVLDGAVDPALSGDQLNLAQAGGFEDNLEAFLRRCVTGGSCPLGGTLPAARAALDRLEARVDRSPLPSSDGRTLGSGAVFLGLAAALYSPQTGWPELQEALREALAGRGARLQSLADGLTGRGANGRYSNQNDSNLAINCIDRQWSRSLPTIQAEAARAARADPYFGAAIAYGSLPCAYWPVPPVERGHAVAAPDAPPILVVGTTGDPATPYAWSQALAGQLSSGVLLTYRGQGHTAYSKGNACVDAAVNRYLLAAVPPAKGTTCG